MSILFTETNVKQDVLFKASSLTNLNPKNGERLIFTATLYNYGNGYDTKTGIFTAPDAGTYLFTGQLCPKVSKNIHCGIVVDGNDVTRTYAYGLGYHTCYSTDAIVKLEQYSQVWIQSYYDLDELFSDGSRWNTFTGAILH